jgi:glycosyltransferase involved in cell wall biosynthesis
VIVVDDGSTDGSAEVAASYGDRIRLIRQPSGGAAAARNRGIESARGELVAFLDADDIWHREKLAHQVERFRSRPDLDVSVCHMEHFIDPGVSDELARRLRAAYPGGAVPGVWTTVVARRSFFAEVGGLDPTWKLSDSLDCFLRAAENGLEIEIRPDLVAFHRLHASNISQDWETDVEETVDILKASLDRRRAAGSRSEPAPVRLNAVRLDKAAEGHGPPT